MMEHCFKHIGFTTCKYWKDRGLWRDELPITEPPQRGKEAVKIFLKPNANDQHKSDFVAGWNRYLDS